QPALPLDGFSFTILNSGPTVDVASPATGWTTLSSDAKSADFGSGSPVFPGGSVDGFAVRFDPGQQDSVSLQLCTRAGGSDACCDTLTLPVTTAEIRCDSLVLAEVPVPAACSWKTGYVNTHLPASVTTRFRLQAITPGTRFTATGIPAGWMLLDDGSTGTLTLQRDTATSSGLFFDLAVTSPASTALFEWCTADANGPICCGIDSVSCPVDAYCGDMEMRSGSGTLARDLRLRNVISPAAAIDALHLAVSTPGSAFASVQAPAGWTVTLNAARDSVLVLPQAAIATDSASAWFTVTLTEAPGCDSIRWSWTAIASGIALCEAALPPIACATAACDTVLFSTDPARPCCFDISVRSAGSGDIDGLTLAVLTPGAAAFGSTLQSPPDWTLGGDTLFMQWNTATAPISQGHTLSGFTACFSNGWIGNSDFHVRWQTYTGRTLRCEDTVTIACDRTLAVEHLDAPLPAAITLAQNYPNPFRESTSIVFALPQEQRATLRVHDMHGRQVSAICDGSYPAGNYRVHFDAGELPAGTYLLRLTAGGEVRTRLMQLLR
ncbi:MAG: T9SS type A sorting domain-containing protein, partial [Bacteroidota bacterium]|nr:T9SS type A sorting domain-containing protein [Bacteroidota bacterium]